MYTFDSRVRYSEVNSERQMTLSALLDYLQDCCTFQSEELGVGLDYLTEQQTAWILLSWEIEILRYPVMGERVKVGTWPYDFKGFYGWRNFVIQDESGNMLAKANSLWVFMDVERMRPARIPKELLAVYGEKFEEPLPGEWGDRKIAVPESGEAREPVQVARFHIDTNHHMNNGKYVQAAEEYLSETAVVKRLRVEYKKAALLGDILYPAVVSEAGRTTVKLADAEGKAYAVVQFLYDKEGHGC